MTSFVHGHIKTFLLLYLCEGWFRHQLPVLELVQPGVHRLLDMVLQVLDQLAASLVTRRSLAGPAFALWIS